MRGVLQRGASTIITPVGESKVGVGNKPFLIRMMRGRTLVRVKRNIDLAQRLCSCSDLSPRSAIGMRQLGCTLSRNKRTLWLPDAQQAATEQDPTDCTCRLLLGCLFQMVKRNLNLTCCQKRGT
jgi:hypothetical protein